MDINEWGVFIDFGTNETSQTYEVILSDKLRIAIYKEIEALEKDSEQLIKINNDKECPLF